MKTTRDVRANSIVFLHFAIRVVAFPVLIVYFVLRGVRDRRYFRTLAERLGFLPRRAHKTSNEAIWLHAVSVGEVLSSIGLIEEIKRRQPSVSIFVSTTTLAGRALADKRLHGLAGAVFYAPIDYAFAVRRVLRRLRPSAVIILETEIWPVLFREVRRVGSALLVVNGRLSDRALPRYRFFRFLFRQVLAWPDAILVQSERDAERYVSIGAPAKNVRVCGNLKYDTIDLTSGRVPEVDQLLKRVRPQYLWIAASTMPGADGGDIDEDKAVIASFPVIAARHPDLLLILAPRRPERFDQVAEHLRAKGIRFLRRTELTSDSTLPLPGVLLLDTIGELSGLFTVADVVFMGGTLARRGGHNILEPAAFGKPIITGPHLENFAAIAADFRAAGALVEIADASELSAAVSDLLESRERRRILGERSKALVSSKGGAAARLAAEVLEALDQALPLWGEWSVAWPLFWLLSRLWILGTRIRRRREVARKLNAPVVSIGGIAMGGVGKTPFCARIAKRLSEGGDQPAILTRGYRRRSLEESIILEAGALAPARMTGDEAQILVRFAHAHIGIGADRWQTGRRLEEKLKTEVFLLDDGFQHTRLGRNLDIVLIDALDPFPGNGVFPLGRLREPLSSLRRAGCFVITRAHPNRRYAGVRGVLSHYNPDVPVFLARVEARSWINERTREPSDLPAGPVVAFCGLGNPVAFWRMLDKLEIQPAFRWTFGDHHNYIPRELKRLALQGLSRGASALLTTEKDAMNLPERALEAIQPLDLYWLKIDVQVEKEDDLISLIESKINR